MVENTENKLTLKAYPLIRRFTNTGEIKYYEIFSGDLKQKKDKDFFYMQPFVIVGILSTYNDVKIKRPGIAIYQSGNYKKRDYEKYNVSYENYTILDNDEIYRYGINNHIKIRHEGRHHKGIENGLKEKDNKKIGVVYADNVIVTWRTMNLIENIQKYHKDCYYELFKFVKTEWETLDWNSQFQKMTFALPEGNFLYNVKRLESITNTYKIPYLSAIQIMASYPKDMNNNPITLKNEFSTQEDLVEIIFQDKF